MVPRPVLTERATEREVSFTRLFDAPVELLWDAWTDPRHLNEWWGPSGFKLTTHEFAFVPGGVWRFIMHGPNGIDYPNLVVFREIAPLARIVYDNRWDLPDAPLDFTGVVTFTSHGKQSELSQRMTFANAAAMKIAVERYGVLDGGRQTFERLAERVE